MRLIACFTQNGYSLNRCVVRGRTTHEVVIWLRRHRRKIAHKMETISVETVESVAAAYAVTDDPKSSTESVPALAPDSAFYGVDENDEIEEDMIDWELVEWKLFGRNVRGTHLPHLRERCFCLRGLRVCR